MIEITTTQQNFEKDLNETIKKTILYNIDDIVKKGASPFLYNNYLRDANILKDQLVSSLSLELEENFPDTFIESGEITKNSLKRALTLNLAKGEFKLIKEDLEINKSFFKNNKDFLKEEFMSEDEWLEDYEGDTANMSDQELEDMFESDSEEEEETRMYDFIEKKIEDGNILLNKIKNNKYLQRFNTVWI